MVLKLLDLFSGIGGFSYAAERIVGGYETTQFVEIDPYCQSVLRKNFPNVPIHDDIKTFTAKPRQFDVFTIGFPCQDLSVAGRQRGIGEGTRSGLFYESIRLLREVQPRFAIFENVRNLLSHEKGETFQEILFQIAKAGYDAEWSVISAKDLGACHLRQRLWIIAYSNGFRCGGGNSKGCSIQERPFLSRKQKRREVGSQIEGCSINTSNPQSQSSDVAEPKSSFNKESHKSEFGNSDSKFTNSRFITNPDNDGSSSSTRIPINDKTNSSTQERQNEISKSERSSKPKDSGIIQQTSKWRDTEYRLNPDWRGYVSKPSLCRGDDGLSNRVLRLKALGNSIVPNCAAVPLQRIKDLNEELW